MLASVASLLSAQRAASIDPCGLCGRITSESQDLTSHTVLSQGSPPDVRSRTRRPGIGWLQTPPPEYYETQVWGHLAQLTSLLCHEASTSLLAPGALNSETRQSARLTTATGETFEIYICHRAHRKHYFRCCGSNSSLDRKQRGQSAVPDFGTATSRTSC